MYPRYFEFNTQLLLALAEHMCSGLYGTFICNSQGERMSKITDVETKTASFWSHVHAQHESYQNPIYKPEGTTGASIRLSRMCSLTHTPTQACYLAINMWRISVACHCGKNFISGGAPHCSRSCRAYWDECWGWRSRAYCMVCGVRFSRQIYEFREQRPSTSSLHNDSSFLVCQ